MDGNPAVGLLVFVAIALAPIVVGWLLIHANGVYDTCLGLGRRLHLVRTPPEAPWGPPLEKLAADLRRLRAEARLSRPGTTAERQLRVLASYDTTLVATARALEVPTALDDIPESLERELERQRIERVLTVAGLTWQVQEN
jgi:hypothetical protein